MELDLRVSNERSKLYTFEGYLEPELATELLSYFSSSECPLTADPTFKMYGKVNVMHRRIGFFSDVSRGYPFSKQMQPSLPLTDTLKMLIYRVNESLGTNFNGILVNHYRDGTDSIGRHSDKEITLANGVVAGISLGVSRIFRIREVGEKSPILADINTTHNQLLLMTGDFQRDFTHEIPKSLKVKGERVSLTFRTHVEDK